MSIPDAKEKWTSQVNAVCVHCPVAVSVGPIGNVGGTGMRGLQLCPGAHP